MMPRSTSSRRVAMGNVTAPVTDTPATTEGQEHINQILDDAPLASDDLNNDVESREARDDKPTPEATTPIAPNLTDHPSNTVPSADVDVSKCGYKNAKGNRSCQLPRDHELRPIVKGKGDGHLYRVVNSQGKPAAAEVAAIIGDLDLDAASSDVAPGDEVVQVKEVVRDANQQKIDAMIEASFKAWTEAGKPAEFNKSPRKVLRVPPAAVPGIRKMLERAGTLHSVRVRIAPAVTEASGNAAVYFVACDKLERETKPATDAPATDAPATDAPATDAPATASE